MLKLLFVLAVIIYGIKRKIFVGYLLAVVGICTPLLFGKVPLEIGQTLLGTLTSMDIWRLFLAIVIVMFLGQILKAVGSFDKLTEAAQHLAGGKRTAAAVLPATIGMMPMPAGALLSAPLVKEVLKDENMKPEFLAATNYWYRHVMEFFWPLYPGIILGAGICGIPQHTFSSLGIIMTLSMIIIGAFLFLRKIPNGTQKKNSFKSIIQIIVSIWPLFLAVLLAFIFKIDIVLALLAALIVTMLTHKGSWAHFWHALRASVTLKLFLMIFGILVFKDMLAMSGAVADMPAEVARLGIHPAFIIFFVAFLTGLMSGMVAMYVGLSFPILAGFLYSPDINLGNIFLAYLSGYLGIILAPTHFCLLLSSEYYKADLGKVYRAYVPGIIILAAVGITLYITGYPWGLIGV
ncbi:MAG: DUF401 family protein [candidate division Zixibacteria bacterium]|nr:DUF401 family protein [candidate division Zixibacteria bacterium]